MKKIWKTLWITVLCTLILGMTATAASPAVAAIGKKTYTSLEEALQKVKKGQTIKLKRNVTLTEDLNLNRNVKFTLDLGKKTITCGSDDVAVCVLKGDVTFKNGAIKGSVAVKKGAKLTVSSGTYRQFLNMGTLVVKNGKAICQGDQPFYNVGGKLTIKKGTVKGNRGCVYINGGTVSISGGTFTNTDTTNDVPLIAVEKGTLTVSGGKYTSQDCTLFNYNGKVVLKKGTFTSTDFCTVVNNKNMVISGATINYKGSAYCGLFCHGGSTTEIKKGTVKGKKISVIVDAGYSKFKLSGGKVQNSSQDLPPVCINEAKSAKASVKTKYISTPCGLKIIYME